MSWNYRVCKESFPDEDSFTVREVYYDESGQINGWTDPVGIYGETFEDLKGALELYAGAFEKPVVDLDKLRS